MAHFGQPIPTRRLSRTDYESCFELLKTNLYHMYRNSGMGWSSRDKRAEMNLENLFYSIVKEEDILVAFASYMIDTEAGLDVVYIYELQIRESHQRRGVGQELMSRIEAFGRAHQVQKSMLTVFTSNEAAENFYHKLGYAKDASSPEGRRLRGKLREPSYRILSKCLLKSV